MNNRIPDIFISYSTKDRAWVEKLAIALGSCGYSVWWDRQLLPGQNFHQNIQNALDNARCVVTVWSENAVESRWVQGESSQALDRGVMVPVLYQPVRIPAGFHSVHYADLRNWDGRKEDANFHQLQQAIDKIVYDSTQPKEVTKPKHSPGQTHNKSKKGFAIPIAVALIIALAWLLFPSTDKKQTNNPSVTTLSEAPAETSSNNSTPPTLTKLFGEWRGTYQAGQGETGITLTFKRDLLRGIIADWQFYAVPSNLKVPSGHYIANVEVNEANGVIYIKDGEWISQPSGYGFAGLTGTLSQNATVFSGIVGQHNNWKFRLVKQ